MPNQPWRQVSGLLEIASAWGSLPVSWGNLQSSQLGEMYLYCREMTLWVKGGSGPPVTLPRVSEVHVPHSYVGVHYD